MGFVCVLINSLIVSTCNEKNRKKLIELWILPFPVPVQYRASYFAISLPLLCLWWMGGWHIYTNKVCERSKFISCFLFKVRDSIWCERREGLVGLSIIWLQVFNPLGTPQPFIYPLCWLLGSSLFFLPSPSSSLSCSTVTFSWLLFLLFLSSLGSLVRNSFLFLSLHRPPLSPPPPHFLLYIMQTSSRH